MSKVYPFPGTHAGSPIPPKPSRPFRAISEDPASPRNQLISELTAAKAASGDAVTDWKLRVVVTLCDDMPANVDYYARLTSKQYADVGEFASACSAYILHAFRELHAAKAIREAGVELRRKRAEEDAAAMQQRQVTEARYGIVVRPDLLANISAA